MNYHICKNKRTSNLQIHPTEEAIIGGRNIEVVGSYRHLTVAQRELSWLRKKEMKDRAFKKHCAAHLVK